MSKEFDSNDMMIKNLKESFEEVRDEWRRYMDTRLDRHNAANKAMDERFEKLEGRFAGKYIEWLVWPLALGALSWMMNQVLQMIPVAKAFIENIIK